ncbi:MAG: right-handed parallel beta-helix repeat-containing protein [bacterium]
MCRSYCFVACLVMGVLGAACGDSVGQQDCPDGFERRGAACVPIFDTCPGPAEIPLQGGGCQAVGVTTCATGLFVSDGEGGCDPILPPSPCPPGTMEVLGQTECRSVGVTECASGFISDGEGGCEAILPAAPCPAGTLALLGHTDCQPIGDCGSGPWGNIVDDPTTIYVDQTADATGADGTAVAPFPTVTQALAAVPSGGQIAIAAGDYASRLTIDLPVRLTGRCAELVTLRGQVFLGSPRPPLRITSGGTGSAVRGVALTGPGEGLMMEGAQQVTVEEVEVRDTESYGVLAFGAAQASLSRVKVAGCSVAGIALQGSSLELSESVVRDSPARSDGLFGRGINAECVPGGVCGSLVVASSLVAGNRDTGLFAQGVETTVTATVVRGTLPQQSNGMVGHGIHARCDSSVPACGSLDVTGSLVEGNHEVGIFVAGVDAAITSTVVRDNLARQSDGLTGVGIEVRCDPDAGICGRADVVDSLVDGNRVVGILATGVDTTVTTSLVRGTLPQESTGALGLGIEAACDEPDHCGSLTVASSLVVGNRDRGIVATGVDLSVTATVVRDTLAQQSDGTNGWGICAQCEYARGLCGRLSIVSSLIVGNRELGVFAEGVHTVVQSSVVRDPPDDPGGDVRGLGIIARCAIELASCGSLSVSGSLLSRIRGVGILAGGVEFTVTDTVVRDTQALADGTLGQGIAVACDPDLSVCGSLVARSSLVQTSQNAGIMILGTRATLEGVIVRDTRPNEAGILEGEYGQAIWAMSRAGAGLSPVDGDETLQLTRCLLDRSFNAGLALLGVSGSLRDSAIRQVAEQPVDGRYGYGVQIEGLEGEALPTFDVWDCALRDARLAGVLYYRAGGTLGGSSVSGGENSVIMNEGSSPTIRDDNDLSGTIESEPTWANVYPSPAPPPLLPQ